VPDEPKGVSVYLPETVEDIFTSEDLPGAQGLGISTGLRTGDAHARQRLFPYPLSEYSWQKPLGDQYQRED